MVDDLETVNPVTARAIELSDDSLEMLLLRFLEELVYLKDTERLLLRPDRIEIHEHDGSYHMVAGMAGEKIDFNRHALSADIKAVTLYRFTVARTAKGWNATVVLDI
jgi:SHS2 domain-containing protein